LTSYLHRTHRTKIVVVAAVATLAVALASPPPSHASLVCPPGTSNPAYCKTVIKLQVKIRFVHGKVKVVITVSDPKLTVTLRRNGHLVRRIFKRNVKHGRTLSFHKPTKPGHYTVRVVASVNGVTKTVNRRFTIKKPVTP
jgi:hypothetical protein